MNIVDAILIGALVIFVLVGWHRGFISGVMSFLGFIGGGLLAAVLLPRIVDTTSLPTTARAIIVGIGILAACFIGQFIAGYFGDHLRDAISWTPARTVDRVGGAALNVLVLAVLTWLVVSIASYLPSTSVTDQLTGSKVAHALDALVPSQAQGVFDGVQSVLGATSVQTLFAGIAGLSGPQVDPPDRSAVTPAVQDAGTSIVQVSGYADECGTDVSGSGFVFAPGRVMTNAHVVAGLTEVEIHANGRVPSDPASVVYFDPQGDIAILDVPALRATPLEFAKQEAGTGDPAVIGGFPHSGPYRLTPVRVRTLVTARSEDIYGGSGGSRMVYVVRGDVQRGESGGPMLSPDGEVLGMVFGADPNEAEKGYVIANADLYEAVTRSNDATSRVDTGTCRIRD